MRCLWLFFFQALLLSTARPQAVLDQLCGGKFTCFGFQPFCPVLKIEEQACDLLISRTDGLPSRTSGYTMPTFPSGAALVSKVKVLRRECGGDCRGPRGSSIKGV